MSAYLTEDESALVRHETAVVRVQRCATSVREWFDAANRVLAIGCGVDYAYVIAECRTIESSMVDIRDASTDPGDARFHYALVTVWAIVSVLESLAESAGESA
jgi:hypothetical protein